LLQDINRSLSYLRKNEKFTDLRFVCQSGSGKAKKSVTISAHQAIFAAKSRLMAKLFEISHEKQVSYVVVVNSRTAIILLFYYFSCPMRL
jgi:hypothetical protein